MLNRSGVTKETFTAPKQILANVGLQSSCGCIVPQTLGVTVGTKKIAKAGTPIKIDMMNLQTPAAAPTAVSESDTSTVANAVLLHDVDVTAGSANGTALYFGVVNVNRVDTDVATKLTAVSSFGHIILIKA